MANKIQTLLSAGIDIGTSTTKLIISKLILHNIAGQTQVPRVEIVDQQLVYQSPIFRTPLLDDVTINVDAIEQLVFEQYENAGITPSEIQTGAIIVTGETATKSNASELIHHLSDLAGEFLVATAGPDLESILAARGSGAVAYSKKTGKVVANIDIGGGTTNIAVLEHGEVIGTVTLHVGGRLLSYSDGKLKYIAPSIQRLLKKSKMEYMLGDNKNEAIDQFVIKKMVENLIAVLNKEQNDHNMPLLLGHVPHWEPTIQSIIFSGGVSQYIYSRFDANYDMDLFDDLGKGIAGALMAEPQLQQFEWVEPLETVRATVIGAGSQSTDVSGATIEVHADSLPLKNIPVLQCDFHKQLLHMSVIIQHAIEQAQLLFDSEHLGEPFALYLKDLPYMNFDDIVQLATSIASNWPQSNALMLLVLQEDYAKVLGQSLLQLETTKQIVCIDQIFVRNGDYIDIGKPLATGVVPVVVKTLAFHEA